MAAQRFQSWQDVGVIPKSGVIKYCCPKCKERKPEKNYNNRDLYIHPDHLYFRCYSPSCEWNTGGFIDPKKRDYKRPEPKPLNTTWGSFWGQERAVRGFKTSEMEERGICPATFYWDTPLLGLRYPFFDVDGTLITYAYRPQDKAMGFRFEKGAELCFYNLKAFSNFSDDQVIPYILITEGFDDAESFIKAGVTLTISVPNGVSVGDKGKVNNDMSYLNRNMDLLDRAEVVYIAVDNDFAGDILREELARRIGKRKCRIVKYPPMSKPVKDASDVLQIGMEQGRLAGALKILAGVLHPQQGTAYSIPYPVEGLANNDSANAEVWDTFVNGKVPGAEIGLPTDEFVTWVKGRFIGVSGKFGSAKTDFICNVMVRLAVMHGWKFAVFMPETGTAGDVKQNLIQIIIGKNIDRSTITKYNLIPPTQDEIEYALNIIDNHIYIIDEAQFKGGLTVPRFLELGQELVKTHGVDCLVGDPFNAFQGAYGSTEGTGADALNAVFTDIQRFCVDYNCSVLFAPHPSGKGYNGQKDITELIQLNYGAIWGNKLHVGMLLSRIEGTATNGYGDDVSFMVRKVKRRNEGKLGEGTMAYCWATGRFGIPASGTSSARFETFVPNFQSNGMPELYTILDTAPF